MLQEQRQVYFDRDLEIEAYHLSGIAQKFPNHFHEHYVIGFIEGGKRHLWCKNVEYDLIAGDLILFNPRDNHFCTPIDGKTLDYRAINISKETMRKAVKEITNQETLPYFKQNVIHQSDITGALRDVYNGVVENAPKLPKEEAFFFLLEQILQDYCQPLQESNPLEQNQQMKVLCSYMEEHFADNITLDELLSMAHCSKSYLLRTFTKEVGVSPYRYLQTIRLNKAKAFLEEGMAPIDVAITAGFSDQSHFTNYFKEFIGLTPKQYQRIFTEAPNSTKPAKEWQNEE